MSEMTPADQQYLEDLATELSRLYGFARQMNELDFAGALGGEFRGAQDPGWSTTITAAQVREELRTYLAKRAPLSRSAYRIVLMLYCQLAEAGGVYESIKNVMGVVTRLPYNLWPFRDLVRVRKQPAAVIGPNANKTFRDLATTAEAIGMLRLARLLGSAFRDDIRNGIAHADYVIWDDGLRLRRRNGGNADKVPHDEVQAAILRGIAFYDILQHHNSAAMDSFNPAKEIVGKFSGNPPMAWTVLADPEAGTFSMSSSSPGSATTPAYLRQVEINERLGGRVLAAFPRSDHDLDEEMIKGIEAAGFEPHVVVMDAPRRTELLEQIDRHSMLDSRRSSAVQDGLLLASPFGFTSLGDLCDIEALLPPKTMEIRFGETAPESG
ncbi:hypothetical protein FJV80_07800 [Mesorhizobium sp. WSM4310]|uniref:hypothetical protein n=1 Tax=Mesorhizobium sp. WSM4310 TaxID=2589883 RepID=UPI00115CE148|nr:hypothetical protein [Mesorhizobium sp. WSM4310]TRC89687.1 hypothetical protein FJV80_07800 [Mesorhizobium sp. WSM4310]